GPAVDRTPGVRGPPRPAAEHCEKDPAGLGGGGVDDRAVHANAHRAQGATEHRHADVDDVAGLAGDRVGVLDLPDLPGGVAAHEVLVHEIGWHKRHEGMGDLCPGGVVHH